MSPELVDYALDHQAELIAVFEKMNGRKKKPASRRKAPAKVIEIESVTK